MKIDPVTIQLRYPIDHGDVQVEELKVRPVTARDLRRVKADPNKSSYGFLYELASLLTGQPQAVIDKVMGEDLGALNTAVSDFLSLTQPRPKPSKSSDSAADEEDSGEVS